MLDLAGHKTNIRAHDVLDATIESFGPPKFSRQAFWSRISGWQQPLLHRTAAVVTLRSAHTAWTFVPKRKGV